MRVVIELSGRGRAMLVVIALAVAVAIPATVLASHLFTDVPDASPYHADISALALSGVTTGCDAGNFCPTGNVTREQMAAFMHRSSGRVASDDVFGSLVAPGIDVVVSSLSIKTGVPNTALASANGFLKIDGSVSLFEDNADLCDCFASVQVKVDGVAAGPQTFVWLDNDAGYQLAVGSISVVVPVASGNVAVQLVVNEYTGNETLAAYATLTALYVPFGGQGTDAASIPAAAHAGVRPGAQ